MAALSKRMVFSIFTLSPAASRLAARTSARSCSCTPGDRASSNMAHCSVMEVCNEAGSGAQHQQDLLPARQPCPLLTVSTPPAIISVTLALMSSRGSLSCMMRLQRMPMYSLVLLRCSRRSR